MILNLASDLDFFGFSTTYYRIIIFVVQICLAVLGGGLGSAILTYIRAKKNLEAEEKAAIIKEYKKLLNQTQQELDDLQKKYLETLEQNIHMSNQIKALQAEIDELKSKLSTIEIIDI